MVDHGRAKVKSGSGRAFVLVGTRKGHKQVLQDQEIIFDHPHPFIARMCRIVFMRSPVICHVSLQHLFKVVLNTFHGQKELWYEEARHFYQINVLKG